jgi:predicted deacylase
VQFRLDSIPCGTKRALKLPGPVTWQVLLARGKRVGRTILVLGGVHGDEYEGPMAIHQLFGQLQPRAMSGLFVGVPICNPLAFAAKQRTTPGDGKNLARRFPGNARGTVTDRIADVLHQQFIARADFVVDLHSSGSQWTMPTLSGYIWGKPALDKIQRQACERFGAPVIWASPHAPGRTLSSAYELNIPAIYTETAGQNGCQGNDVDLYANGVRNVMVMLGILPVQQAIRVGKPKLVIQDRGGYGDLDTSVKAEHDGLFVARRRVMDRVKRGELIGELFRGDGKPLQRFRASRTGRLFLIRHAAPTRKGDLVFQVT